MRTSRTSMQQMLATTGLSDPFSLNQDRAILITTPDNADRSKLGASAIFASTTQNRLGTQGFIIKYLSKLNNLY
jgi:hypothetical protein